MEKLKYFVNKLLTKFRVGVGNTPRPLKSLTIVYILFVFLVLVIYLGSWVFLFINAKVDLKDLLSLANLLISNAMIGFVTFSLGLFIDSNGNGIPDNMEKEVKNDARKPITKL